MSITNMPRKQKTPYTCPCCGYYTTKKTHMYRHLYELLKPCPQLENNTELTDEVKIYILKNRVLQPLKSQSPTPQSLKGTQRKQTISHALRVTCWNTYIGEEVGRTTCLCCKSNFITQLNFHCGHVIPECKGGTLRIDNLLPICNVCNNSMGTMDMKEFKEMHGF
jgi:5-methylcytosine-specific restriction endonuclease McrA